MTNNNDNKVTHIVCKHECSGFDDKLLRLLILDNSSGQTCGSASLATGVHGSGTELLHLPSITTQTKYNLDQHVQHISTCKATTHTHTQPFNGSMDFVWDNPSEPVPKETFTHSHLPWSTIILYLLPPSTAIVDILPVQYLCLTVFLHNLCPRFVWSTSWPGTCHFILHTYLH